MALQAQTILRPQLAAALLTGLRAGPTAGNGAAAGVSANGQAAPASILAPGEFSQHLTAMRAFYQTAPDHAYPLPVHILHPIGLRSPVLTGGVMTGGVFIGGGVTMQPLDPLQQINQETRTGAQSWAYGQENVAKQTTQNLQSSGDASSFMQQMEQNRQKAVTDATNNINQAYDKWEKLGTDNPDLQPAILKIAQEVGAFFSSLIKSVGDFFANLAAKVIAWIQTAAQWVGQAFAAAADWASGAVSSIGDFFASL